MPSVDNRIVRMEFDNATFQSRVAQTIKSLADLDKALKLPDASKGFADITSAASRLASSINFSGIHKGLADTATQAAGLDKALRLDGAKQGLADVSSAAHKVDLSPIATSIQRVSTGFLTLSTIAVTALATITQHALLAGANIAKALSFDLVQEGFREFETNIGSIQTILANTRREGTQLSDVTAALDKLNEFSDRTIYNFGQMAKNIGTFTAAGVDLDTSVNSIKGIANLAALSGASAEQASGAMYQLSQAISTGTLRLIDWNSVVNAGLGGEVFQRALFDTAVAMGTITDAPVGTTFDQWTAAGNSFRDSLQEGWLTAEVLTTTLGQFTGDMTEAQLLSIGFTQQQAAEILALGDTAVESATKIRTFSQLLTTIRETIGSGWSQTFRAVIGDFEESTELFTSINDAISNFIKSNADARTALLEGWSDLGGRTQLIKDLGDTFKGLGRILETIREAFREVFPPLTAERLVEITEGFGDFIRQLIPTTQTITKVKRIFEGLFSALDIGWEIVKNGVGFIKDLVAEVTGIGSGGFLEFAASIGDFFTGLREGLDQGEKIKQFFDDLKDVIQSPIDRLKNFREAVVDLFSGLGDFAGPLLNFFESVGAAIGRAGELISEWFGDFKEKLAETFGVDSFQAATSGISVGLLGGIALALKKFLDEGISLDLTGGIMEQVSDALTELTGTLKAMQSSIKADALLKIAGAIALLTASIVVLSLIEPDKLTAALTAITVGFGQLVGAFAVLQTFDLGFWNGARFVTIATGIAIMAGALLILSGVIAILASMSWTELAKGLGAVTIMLGLLTGAAILISRFSGSFIATAVALGALSVALIILAGAIKLFSNFEWDEMLRGFTGIAVGLAILAGAMRLMPAHLFVQAAGLVLVATALVILGQALEKFTEFDWGEIARGLVAMGAALLIIAGAMHLMPNLVLTGAGLILVSIALKGIAEALDSFGQMDWGEIGKGLVAMAAALIVISAAAFAMEGSVGGAIGLFIFAQALVVLAEVLQGLAEVPFGDLAKAIGAMAVALLVLVGIGALAQVFSVGLLALGASFLLVGAAFLAFGIGAEKVANAFKTLAENGEGAAEGITQSIEAIGRALPALIVGFAKGLVDLIKVIGTAAAEIARAIGKILDALLDEVIQLLPKIGEVTIRIIEEMIRVIRETAPDLIEVGNEVLILFLEGISENIEQVTELVIDILEKFLNTVAENIDRLVEAGTNVIVAFLLGIANNIGEIQAAATNIIVALVTALGTHVNTLITAGFNVLMQFLSGIAMNIIQVVILVGQLISAFITEVGNQATAIATAGFDALVDFLGGITNNLYKVTEAVGTMITTFITAVGNQATNISNAGANALIRFIEGLGRNIGRVVTAGVDTVISFIQGIGQNAVRLAAAAFDVVTDFLNALASVIRQKSPELRAAGANIAIAIADGFTGGLASKARSMAQSAVDAASGAKNAVEHFLGIGSPSKVFEEIGGFVVDGFARGLRDTGPVEAGAETLANAAVSSFRTIITTIADEMGNMEDVAPTITPVLDLSTVYKDAETIKNVIGDTAPLIPSTSFTQAQVIAKSPSPNQVDIDNKNFGQAGVTFNQTINAPEQLSSAEIYKQTRNQITIAKEDLKIP